MEEPQCSRPGGPHVGQPSEPRPWAHRPSSQCPAPQPACFPASCWLHGWLLTKQRGLAGEAPRLGVGARAQLSAGPAITC